MGEIVSIFMTIEDIQMKTSGQFWPDCTISEISPLTGLNCYIWLPLLHLTWDNLCKILQYGIETLLKISTS